MVSPDKPFMLRGGTDVQAAMHNRIAAIERIKFLSGVDLRQRDLAYMMALDLELFKRWYRYEKPDKQIDEEWCQRAAEVVKDLEKDRASITARRDEIIKELEKEKKSVEKVYKPDNKSNLNKKGVWHGIRQSISSFIDRCGGLRRQIIERFNRRGK